MMVTGLGWCGTRTDKGAELAAFYQDVMGLAPLVSEPGFWVFELPDGTPVEIFGAGYRGREHFNTGPVVGFAVADLDSTVAELRAAGVELLPGAGPTWQHLRAPDGNVYALTTD